MYSLHDVRRGLQEPTLLGRELNRLYHLRLYTRSYNESGINVISMDWDYLLLLDGCRYDTFAEHSDLPGNLSSVLSRGSSTPEFLRGNIEGRDLLDTVYVNANPQFIREAIDATFYDEIHLWEDEGWHDELGTVLPETVTRRALEVHEQYPNKRLFLHYIQPHYPFIESPTTFDKDHLHDPDDKKNMWEKLGEGVLEISREQVRELYTENLLRALPHVKEFITSVEGKSVVTADHGNLFGERVKPVPMREWGHPGGIHVNNLLKVPWLTYTRGDRPTITEGEPRKRRQLTGDEAENHLRNLGYK